MPAARPAPPLRTDSGRSSTSICAPRERTTARSIACSSSRTLPGHGYASRAESAARVSAPICFPFFAA